jgi:hypothetical protein
MILQLYYKQVFITRYYGISTDMVRKIIKDNKIKTYGRRAKVKAADLDKLHPQFLAVAHNQNKRGKNKLKNFH